MAPTSSTCPSWTSPVALLVLPLLLRRPGLTWCALLGLIASAGTGSTPADIELVKGLVTEYAKNESCIILLTVTCESASPRYTALAVHSRQPASAAEFENQGAYHLARTFDPAGKRTIGTHALAPTPPTADGAHGQGS